MIISRPCFYSADVSSHRGPAVFTLRKPFLIFLIEQIVLIQNKSELSDLYTLCILSFQFARTHKNSRAVSDCNKTYFRNQIFANRFNL